MPAPTLEGQLERRRLLTLRCVAVAAVIPLVALPVAFVIDQGSETSDSITGALFLLSIAGGVAAPWITLVWQRAMARRMLQAIVEDMPGIHYACGENGGAVQAGLQAAGADFGLFRASGLVERFESAEIVHLVHGEAGSTRFALAEAGLWQDETSRVFAGVLGSFALPFDRPGVTIVARDRGLFGNMLQRAGSSLERLTLEDPTFEAVFEAYGTDQVLGRVVLTTTMLERLRQLDEHAQARGFVCAFIGGRLLIVLEGMRWRCPSWRLLQPVGRWLPAYRLWLERLIELPAAILATLRLEVLPPVNRPATTLAVPPMRNPQQAGVLGHELIRLIAGLGLPLIHLASGVLFGGLALAFGWYGLVEGISEPLFWPAVLLIGLGICVGIGGIVAGLRAILVFFWYWKAPLRGLAANPKRR